MQIINKSSTWMIPGNKITIDFKWNELVKNDDNPNVEEFVKNINRWKSHADICWQTLKGADRGRVDPHILVKFIEHNEKPCSYLGNMANRRRDVNEPTMFIRIKKKSPEKKMQDWYDKQFQRCCIHEFGHALGLEHGHIDPDFIQKLDLEKIKSIKGNALYEELLNSAKDEYDNEGILKKRNDKDEIITKQRTAFDPLSVMNYDFPPELFKPEFSNEKISWNYLPSKGDIDAIKVAYG